MNEPQALKDDQLLSATGGGEQGQVPVTFQITLKDGLNVHCQQQEMAAAGVPEEEVYRLVPRLNIAKVKYGCGLYQVTWTPFNGPITIKKIG